MKSHPAIPPSSRAHSRPRAAFLLIATGLPAIAASATLAASGESMAPPVVEGPWLRPAATTPAQPLWGHAKGLRVGLAPLPGPRGLLRVYAPQTGLPERRVINFIAVEPISAGSPHRGLSELERSGLDGSQGKRFWSADAPGDASPRRPESPARGVVEREGGVEMLRVFVFVEPFNNGARVRLRLTFRADRPDEVGIATFAQSDSKPMDRCIVTATMGNYARLRRLYLKDRVVLAGDLWPGFEGDRFAPHRAFPLSMLWRSGTGDVLVAATPNEANPEAGSYAPDTPPWWKYRGPAVTQYWWAEKPDPKLIAQVNGRATYWASTVPIPGGAAYENFELVVPYRERQELWFGVTAKSPQALGLAVH